MIYYNVIALLMLRCIIQVPQYLDEAGWTANGS